MHYFIKLLPTEVTKKLWNFVVYVLSLLVNTCHLKNKIAGSRQTKVNCTKYWNLSWFQSYFLCDLKVSRSRAKIDENFVNNFLKTKANKGITVLKCTCTGLQKSISFLILFYYINIHLKKTFRCFLDTTE